MSSVPVRSSIGECLSVIYIGCGDFVERCFPTVVLLSLPGAKGCWIGFLLSIIPENTVMLCISWILVGFDSGRFRVSWSVAARNVDASQQVINFSFEHGQLGFHRRCRLFSSTPDSGGDQLGRDRRAKGLWGWGGRWE